MGKKRVVAYIRVSTKSERQSHSYMYQEDYWREVLMQKNDCELVGIYADNGISGRLMRKRPQFMSMIEDCKAGLIDEICVKSVSRFSRNTVELLDMVRQLRELNVAVYFEQENINTLSSTSDLELSIAAALADADLVRYSENMKWSIAHKYANGVISVGNGLYGYRMTKDNELVPHPEESQIVKLIYDKYLNGESYDKIANTLDSMGVPTKKGTASWDFRTIKMTLTNERYAGISIQHKSVKINGAKVDNKGGIHRSQLIIENSHEAIISKETFDAVQELMYQRANKKILGSKQKVYDFTGDITCECCNSKYTHKINNSGTKYQSEVWVCNKWRRKGAKACGNIQIKDSVLKEKFIECYNEFVSNKYDNDIVEEAKTKRSELLSMESNLRTLYTQGYIRNEDYKTEVNRIIEKIKIEENIIYKYKMKNVTEEDFEQITEYDSVKYNKFVTAIKINKYTVTFVFMNGVEISKPYSNGQAGNKGKGE